MTATAAFLRNYLVVTGQVVAAVVQAWLHSSGDTDRGPQRTLLVEHAGYKGRICESRESTATPAVQQGGFAC